MTHCHQVSLSPLPCEAPNIMVHLASGPLSPIYEAPLLGWLLRAMVLVDGADVETLGQGRWEEDMEPNCPTEVR